MPSATFHNFEPVLRGYCRMVKAQCKNPRVLEWGPGKSTEIILDELPTASVVSIEHEALWYDNHRNLRLDKRVEMLLIRREVWQGELDWYATFPLQQKNDGADDYDLVFVDGVQRMNCLCVSRIVCPHGPVLMHDYKSYTMYSPSHLFRSVREYKKYDTLAMCNQRMPTVKV